MKNHAETRLSDIINGIVVFNPIAIKEYTVYFLVDTILLVMIHAIVP